MAAQERGELPDDPPPEARRALRNARRLAAGNEAWPLERWYRAITRMRRLSAKHGLGLHKPHSDILDLPNGALGQTGRETVMVLEPRPKPKIGEVYRGLSIVYPDAPNERIPLGAVGEIVPCASLPVLVVSLVAADEHILAEVERVLRERDRSKALPRTTGPSSLSRILRGGYAPAHWRKYHIIELVEMLSWRKVGSHMYSQKDIGSWIDPQRLGSDKKASEAVGYARQAIALLPEIMSEVKKTAL